MRPGDQHAERLRRARRRLRDPHRGGQARDPLDHDDDRGDGGGAGDRLGRRDRRTGPLAAGDPRGGAGGGGEIVSAPFGRRLCEVASNRDSGGYRIVSLVDREGPEPAAGQVYMLASATGWDSRDGPALLPRAISVAATMPAAGGGVRLDFLLDPVGPGTARLCDLSEGEGVWVTGPLG